MAKRTKKQSQIRPYGNNAPGHTNDDDFGRVWIKDSEGSIASQKDLAGRYCDKPFTWLEIDMLGRMWICCPSWVPYSIGNILYENIEDVWNNDKVKKLREQVFNGKWNYCSHIQCPRIQGDTLPTLKNVDNNEIFTYPGERDAVVKRSTHVDELPQHINFSNDESCNLECPSCRIGKILFTEGEEYDRRKRINDRIVENFLTHPTDRHYQINVTGSGDPFASKIYRDMLANINGADFPNLQINLQTNGVMFTPKMWNKIERIHDNLGIIQISYDAGCKTTYENVTRIGGKWDLLLENCDFLNERSKEHGRMKISYDYVVQADNYHEMPRFIDLIRSRYDNANLIKFNLVVDWGTWDRDTYNQKCIWKTTHPDHQDFIEILKDPIFDHPLVSLGNVTPYRKKAIEQ